MLGQGVQQSSEGRLGTQLCPPPPHPPHHAGVSCHPPALPTALSPSPAIKDTKLHSPPGLCVCWCHVDGVAAPQNVTWGGGWGAEGGGGGRPKSMARCGHTVWAHSAALLLGDTAVPTVAMQRRCHHHRHRSALGDGAAAPPCAPWGEQRTEQGTVLRAPLRGGRLGGRGAVPYTEMEPSRKSVLPMRALMRTGRPRRHSSCAVRSTASNCSPSGRPSKKPLPPRASAAAW